MTVDAPDQSFGLQHPWVLALLGLLPLLALLRGRPGAESSVAFSSLHILNRMGRAARLRPAGFAFPILLGIVFVLGILALSRPQLIRQYRVVKESGIEMIIAIDVSRSMLVEDMTYSGNVVNRLTVARAVIRNFVRGRPMDRIGLVAFAGRPYLVSPITLDHDWVQESLSRVSIGLVEDGTAIGSAVAASARRLDQRESKSKVILLITDGANNSGNLSPATAAELAASLGIKIHTIAVGTLGRHTIPTPNGPLLLNQEFDLETLQRISDVSGGQSFLAEDSATLEKIFKTIDTLETTERAARLRVDPSDLFPLLLLLMVGLTLFRMVARETFLHQSP